MKSLAIAPATSFFDNVAYTNAVNDYKVFYAEAGGRILSSNPVSVSVLDGLVQVEGDVWIDEDWDGVQKPNMSNPGHARRDYSNYAQDGSYIIVMQLQNPAAFGFDFASQTGYLYQGIIDTVLAY